MDITTSLKEIAKSNMHRSLKLEQLVKELFILFITEKEVVF